MITESRNIVDPTTARLLCIEEAVKRNLAVQPDWADWLKDAVAEIEKGGVVSAEWLQKHDAQNADLNI